MVLILGIWEYKKLFFVIVAVTLLSTGFTGMSSPVFADKDDKDEKNDYKNHDKDKKKYYKNNDDTTPIINLGFLQLAAHDFFNMQRCMDENRELIPGCIAEDLENGKLDLSTVLFHPQAGDCNFKKSLKQKGECKLYDDYAEIGLPSIANGGELRSVENIMISTASADIGEKYLKLKEKFGEKKAYKKVLKYYHKQLEIAYEESFHLKFPKAKKGEVTNLHNIVVRTGHDFLPAKITFNGVPETSLFLIDPLGDKLSKKEKKQPSSPVDGKFDGEFTGIKFCPIPDIFCIKVNLLAADQDFGFEFADESLGLGPGTFDEMMLELEDGEFNKKDKVSKLLKEAFARGLYFK